MHGQAQSYLGVHAKQKDFDALVYNSARASGISLGCAPWCVGQQDSAWYDPSTPKHSNSSARIRKLPSRPLRTILASPSHNRPQKPENHIKETKVSRNNTMVQKNAQIMQLDLRCTKEFMKMRLNTYLYATKNRLSIFPTPKICYAYIVNLFHNLL